jgi:tetratricopeptide (TPR) repeat protein
LDSAALNALFSDGNHESQVLLLERCSRSTAAALAESLRDRMPTALAASCHAAPLWPFAGLTDLLTQACDLAEATGNQRLAHRHWIELSTLAPSLAKRIPALRPEACFEYRPGEKRRRAGPEWTRRCFHGAIDFLFALKDALGTQPLVLGFIGLDGAGPEVMDFFRLLRRRSAGRPVVIWATASGAFEPSLHGAARVVTAGDSAEEAGPDRTEPSVEELVQAADALAYHGPWRDIVAYCRLALVRMGAEHRALLPTLLSTMRVALNGVNEFPVAEQLLLQQLAQADSLQERVVCLYHLTILHSLWQNHLDVAAFYQDAAFREADKAATPAERADLMLFAVHSALIVYSRQGQLERSLALGEAAMAEFLKWWGPDVQRVQQAILLYGIAQTAEAMGNDLLAVEYFRRSLAADPHFPEYYHHYAAALNRLERYTEALAVCEEAWVRTPPYHWLAMCRGRALQGLGRLQEALADFDRAIELEPEIPEHHLSRALLCHEIGNLQEAVRSYSAYLALRPGDPEALANRGSALHDLGERDAALGDLDQAIALSPSLIAALANRAALLVDLGRVADARADINRALELDPGNELLLQNRNALESMAG